jgi:hypothetical protein
MMARVPRLSDVEWEQPWCVYNTKPWELRQQTTFPVINFDLPETLPDQVDAALAFRGIESSVALRFFETKFVHNLPPSDGWTAGALEPVCHPIWDALIRFSRSLD